MRLLVIICLLLTVGCASQTHPTVHGLANFAVVTAPTVHAAGVYRCGQPDAEGAAFLQSLGVCRRFKFNTTPDSREVATLFTVVWHPIPWYRQIFLQPSLPELERLACEVVPGSEINCAHGQDRTGLFVALYRVLVCHWTCAAAEKEMLANGFHQSLIALWGTWERFRKEQGQ